MADTGNGFEPSFEDGVAATVGPAGIDIVYQRLGQREAPAVVLIMGGMGQLIHWPDSLCRELAGRGLQVIRFDNRDAGLTTHMNGAPVADVRAALAGNFSSASYTLSDMAADTVGLLDALGIERAHIVGASLGGGIAQWIAINHVERVRSLTVMMSSTGNKGVGQPDAEVLRAVFSGPAPVTRDEVIQKMIAARRATGSPAYPADEAQVAELAGRAYDRSYDAAANARQAVAAVAAGDWTERLRTVRAPTLVIHGLADRLVDVSGGRAVAAAIPGAKLWLVEGMGHDFPAPLRPQMAERIAAFVWEAEQRLRPEYRL